MFLALSNVRAAQEISISREVAMSLSLARVRIIVCCVCSAAQAASPVLTRSYDNQRTGANRTETVLKPGNVGGLQKLFSISIPDDPRIEAQPLFVPNMLMPDGKIHNILYVCSMANTVYAFDADTGAKQWSTNLGPPFRPTPGDPVDLNPPINVAWGILATPVIDVDSSTIYIVSLIIDAGGQRALRLNALRLKDGQIRHEALPIQGRVTNTNGQTISLDQVQKQRAALLLTRSAAGPTRTRFSMSRSR